MVFRRSRAWIAASACDDIDEKWRAAFGGDRE
jgi:hypothetical protein